jgi:hypothetical protein
LHNLRWTCCHLVVFKSSRSAGSNVSSGDANGQRLNRRRFHTPPSSLQRHLKAIIKHAIFIIGENRTFYHVFATYVPVNKGESVRNLLSGGIVNGDGTPGPNHSSVFQHQAVVSGTAPQQGLYQISPTTDRQSYTTLPAPLAGAPTVPFVCPAGTTATSCVTGEH